MKLYQNFICFLMASAIPLYGYADCASAIRSAENACESKGHKADWYENCYRKKNESVRQACITNNERAIEVNNKTSEALAFLDEKANDEMAPAQLSIAENNRKLKLINRVVESHSAEMTLLKQQLAEKLATSKARGESILNDYEKSVLGLIDRANNTNDISILMQIRHELESKDIDSVGELNQLITDYSETITSLNSLEERILRELSSVILTLNEEVQSIDFGTQTDIAAAATTWLQSIASNINRNSARIAETLNQKILVNRTVKVKEITDEQFRTANELEKREKYLTSVQMTIANMTHISRSGYRNMMKLSNNYEHALQLIELSHFCSSSAALNWQNMGCNRVAQYSPNANRIANSTTKNSLKFAGMIFARETDQEILNLNDQMLSLLGENDLSGATKVHDEILSNLEG